MSAATCENCASVSELKAELAEVKADIKLIIRLLLSAQAASTVGGLSNYEAYVNACKSSLLQSVFQNAASAVDSGGASCLQFGQLGFQAAVAVEEFDDTRIVDQSPTFRKRRDTLVKCEQQGDNGSSTASQEQDSPILDDNDPNIIREQQEALHRTLDAFNYSVAAASGGDHTSALRRHFVESLAAFQEKGLNNININNNNNILLEDGEELEENASDSLLLNEENYAADQASFSQSAGAYNSSSTPVSVLNDSGAEEATIYECNMCEQSFTSRYRLRVHEKFHSAGLPFACSVCGMSFEQYRYLKVHQKSHTDIRTQMCDVCGVSFASSGQLKRHLAVHFGEKRHMCNYCQKFFSRADNRNTHELRCQLKFARAEQSATSLASQ